MKIIISAKFCYILRRNREKIFANMPLMVIRNVSTARASTRWRVKPVFGGGMRAFEAVLVWRVRGGEAGKERLKVI